MSIQMLTSLIVFFLSDIFSAVESNLVIKVFLEKIDSSSSNSDSLSLFHIFAESRSADKFLENVLISNFTNIGFLFLVAH